MAIEEIRGFCDALRRFPEGDCTLHTDFVDDVEDATERAEFLPKNLVRDEAARDLPATCTAIAGSSTLTNESSMIKQNWSTLLQRRLHIERVS
mmetsp:Transcript_33347/g.83057  ORF Transcript_33347/g.83057 Transcript_33347/m.83057 type:complete len:93 (-) Transcript_33347:1129-1407(-)